MWRVDSRPATGHPDFELGRMQRLDPSYCFHFEEENPAWS